MDVGGRSVAVNKALNEVDLRHLTCVRKRIIGFGGFMPEDVRNVMRLMERGEVNLETFITRAFLPTSGRRLWRSPRTPVAR